MKKNILVAGIGGASLGTEIFKSLKLSKKYRIFAADISPYAYGLYEDGFIKTFLVNGKTYIKDIFRICKREKINAIVPGGEEPLILLNKNRNIFLKKNILLAMNSVKTIEICKDKIKTFNYLKERGVPIPITRVINDPTQLKKIPYPCVIKPSTGSGGSVFVYLAENKKEAELYTNYLKKINLKAIVQEYISDTEGEYTVGVLSLPNGKLVNSIALKRLFHAKLSVLMKTKGRVISSGYSQGIIRDFKKIRLQAEEIAKILDSRGPINIQGRVKNGIFLPFEINPRFSATTYLRTLAGFNEIDIFLDFLLNRKISHIKKINYGYYFRSLEEKFINFNALKKHD